MVKLKRNEVVKEEVSKRINFSLQNSVAQVEKKIKNYEPLLRSMGLPHYLEGAYSILNAQRSRLSNEIAHEFDENGIDFLIKDYLEEKVENFLGPVNLYLEAIERKFALQSKRSAASKEYQLQTKVFNKLVELTGQGKTVKSIDIIRSIEGADPAIVRATLQKIRSQDKLGEYGIVAIEQKSGFLYRKKEKPDITV